jgi:salicylate hydroxylase
MGGLACALALAKKGFESIEVYEFAGDLGFVGAGIQLPPNMARILDRLGCWEEIERESSKIQSTSIRQGSTNEELAHVDLSKVKSQYGYQHQVGHRSNLAGSMYEACKRYSTINFNFSCSVEKIKSFGPHPSFTILPRKGGERYTVEVDVLLGADGIKSNARAAMLELEGGDNQPRIIDTQQAAYRIMLSRDQMQHDPELLQLLDSDTVVRWIEPKRHLIAYPVSGKSIYNISTAHPDTHFAAAPSATYTTRGEKSAMLEEYKDFGGLVHKLLALVPEGEVCEWKLRVHEPLPIWVNQTTALVGDACHPTLPHLSQGAAQAIEDGAVLSIVLSRLPDTSASSINKALRVYQEVRKERADTLVQLAAQSGRTLHLGEGAAKAERDAQFKALKEKTGKNPDKWADADVQRQIFSHDCMQIAEDEFDVLFAKM